MEVATLASCPYCSIYLHSAEVDNYELETHDDVAEITLDLSKHCDCCKSNFKWREYYTISLVERDNISDFREVD